MSIEEAIKHCNEVADSYNDTCPDCDCASDHRQLASWLQELKERREKEQRREEVIRDPDEPYAGGDITLREVYESTSRLIERIIELLPDIVDSVTANMPEAIEQYIESKIRNGKEERK